MKEVYVVSAVRTPLGSFGGVFAEIGATKLGSIAIKGALERAGVKPDQVDEVFMGNVVSANLGQAPARQAALYAGIPDTVPCTTVNKVCASGAKSIMFAAQSIQLGLNDVVIAGGMENMSQIPYYVPKARYGHRYGHGQIIDGLVADGLWDVYNQCLMGVCGDQTATDNQISREEQDAYAIQSYKRSAEATQSGAMKHEIVPVPVPQRKGDPVMVDEDEEYKKVNFDKIPTLKAVFSKDGTVTAANASTINDGASALVLVSEDKLKELGLKPIARVVAYADAAQAPEKFTTTPAKATQLVLQRAGLKLDDIDYFEVNEAFSVVALVYLKELGIPQDKVNLFGGAVSLGHPLGASGARIATTLLNVMHHKGGRYGLLAICNGGGGASAIILERMG
jgi:acetyl-CoA C-acetyltransferase